MSEQWRLQCYNCGSETAEYYRMHSQESADSKRQTLTARDFSMQHTAATCNVCGNTQVIDSQTVVDKGETPLLDD